MKAVAKSGKKGLGEIIMVKDKSYLGQHAAIVDEELSNSVQTMLGANRVERTNGGSARDPTFSKHSYGFDRDAPPIRP